MVQTDNFQLCHQYLTDYIENMKKQLNQYEIKLREQSQRYPITKFSIDQIDSCLKDYVNCQRKYLIIRHKQQLIKFQDNIHRQDLFKTMSSSSRTTANNNQVCINIFE